MALRFNHFFSTFTLVRMCGFTPYLRVTGRPGNELLHPVIQKRHRRTHLEIKSDVLLKKQLVRNLNLCRQTHIRAAVTGITLISLQAWSQNLLKLLPLHTPGPISLSVDQGAPEAPPPRKTLTKP